MKKFLNLKIIKDEIIHTIAQTIISSGQGTQAITLDKSIITKNGSIKNADFLYPNRNIADKNDAATAAWSEGKEASGIGLRSNSQAFFKGVSGLSIFTNCGIIMFIDIARATE